MVASYNNPKLLEEYISSRLAVMQADDTYSNASEALGDVEVSLQEAIDSAFSTWKNAQAEDNLRENNRCARS